MKLSKEQMMKMYTLMYTMRRFEERATEQYRIGNIRGYLHPYTGEEAIAAGTLTACRADDYFTSTHRGHGHAVARGNDLRYMYAELLGKVTGYCKGRGGSMHITNMAQGNLGANGIVGGGMPIAVGAAMAVRQKKGDQVVLCFFGDGGTNIGVFHESLNLASIFHLPVIFVLENNQYAVSTPISYSAMVEDLSCRAAGYGMPGITLDGNDAVKIYEAMQEPLKRARSGQGPTLIECKTFRHGGHHINDPAAYVPGEKMAYWKSRDPLIMMRDYLTKAGFTKADMESGEKMVEKELEEAIQFALSSPEPSVEEFLAETAEA